MTKFLTSALFVACIHLLLPFHAQAAATPDPKVAAKQQRTKVTLLTRILNKSRREESPYAKAVRRNELLRTQQLSSR